MPHAAIFWCNASESSCSMSFIPVSMPHAAIFWCNKEGLEELEKHLEFQCRTRQFSGAMSITIRR